VLSKQHRLAVEHEQKIEVDPSKYGDSVTNQQQMYSLFQNNRKKKSARKKMRQARGQKVVGAEGKHLSFCDEM